MQGVLRGVFEKREVSEHEIISLAIKGDKKAFEMIIDKYKEYIYKTAFMYTKNEHDASDVYQETIYKAFLNIEKLQNPAFFKTWIIRILINNTKDKIKKESKTVLYDTEDYLIDIKTYDLDSNIDLYEAVDRLSGNQKTAVLLKYISDLKVTEIAQIMDCTENTVKSHLYRAMKNLKKELGEV